MLRILRERWEEVRKLTRHYSLHCGNCHGLSPLGSRQCGFCRFAFLSPRVPIHRVPIVVPSGVARDMNRSPICGHVGPARGHTRSDQGQERQYAKRDVKHAYRWDNESGYRIECYRKGMTRDRYQTFVVGPWQANNPDDIPPDPPIRTSSRNPERCPSPLRLDFGAPCDSSWATVFTKQRIYSAD